MVDTKEMMKNLLESNRKYNKQLKFNQKGYIRKVAETNWIDNFNTKEGFEILSEDDGLYKIEYYEKATKPFRLKEKFVSEDEKDFITITYKNGMGAFILNMNTCPKTIFNKVMDLVNKS